MKLLELPDVFTTEEGAGWIRAVDVGEIRSDTLVSWNALHPTIAILPTGRPVRVTHPNIHPIPYSDHSSFSELCEFVKWLKPCSVIPILKSKVCQAYFEQYLSSASQTLSDLKIPKLVQKSVEKPSQKKEREPPCLLKKAAQRSVPQGVVYESPEKYTEKSGELTGVQVAQRNSCKSGFCTWHLTGKDEMSGEQRGSTGGGSAASQAPVHDEHFPTGLAEQYLLTPLNVLKQFSPQTFDNLVEDFFRRGEAS